MSRSARSPSSLCAIGKKNTRDPVLVKSQRVNEINESTIWGIWSIAQTLFSVIHMHESYEHELNMYFICFIIRTRHVTGRSSTTAHIQLIYTWWRICTDAPSELKAHTSILRISQGGSKCKWISTKSHTQGKKRETTQTVSKLLKGSKTLLESHQHECSYLDLGTSIMSSVYMCFYPNLTGVEIRSPVSIHIQL